VSHSAAHLVPLVPEGPRRRAARGRLAAPLPPPVEEQLAPLEVKAEVDVEGHLSEYSK